MSMRFHFATVKLLTKPACTACDASLFVLKRIKQLHPVHTYLKCDIEEDPNYKQYINRVPVVLVD